MSLEIREAAEQESVWKDRLKSQVETWSKGVQTNLSDIDSEIGLKLIVTDGRKVDREM